MTIRVATVDDAAILAYHRATIWHEVGDWGREIFDFAPTWKAYLAAVLADGSYRAWIADIDGAIVGSAGLHLKSTPPRPGYARPLEGRVQGVYVVPTARSRGIARALMQTIIDFARAERLIHIVLHPSDDGRRLYESLGFEPADEMRLMFSP